MTPQQLAARLSQLDWSACSLQHQLAVGAAISTLDPTIKERTMAALTLYDNVVALPVPTLKRTMRHVTLLHLDGRMFATAGFLPGDAGAPWAWIREQVAIDFECTEEAVGCLEPDAEDGGGDFVTVDGLPVLRVAIGHAVSCAKA